MERGAWRAIVYRRALGDPPAEWRKRAGAAPGLETLHVELCLHAPVTHTPITLVMGSLGSWLLPQR